MRTSFHHQPEAQHPNFQLSISWQADYPIFRGEADMHGGVASTASAVIDPKRHQRGNFAVTHNLPFGILLSTGEDRALAAWYYSVSPP
jgi:hypothetical protein